MPRRLSNGSSDLEKGPCRSQPIWMEDKAAPIVVRFVNPTTNKSLHVGHLRNACLGSAAAACLTQLGFRVIRHCILEDVGPHMALAIHGLEKSSTLHRPITSDSEKPDHQAHAYYMYGRTLCTPRHERGRNTPAVTRRRASPRVQISQAVVPEEVLRNWALGHPETCVDATRIKSLALRGQNETLQSFGIGFDCCDYESAETPFVGNFIDYGIAQGVLRRRKDESVVYGTSGTKIILKYGPYAIHESAHLLCFMYRSLTWLRPEWKHVAFAGQEWAPSMRRFPKLLEDLGVTDAARRYIIVFHGMVMASGEKLASQSGRTMLADDLLERLQKLKRISEIARRSMGVMTPTDVAGLLTRLSLLSVPRGRDFEFSYKHVHERGNSQSWRIVEAVARACATTQSSWVNFQPLRKSGDRYQQAMTLCLSAAQNFSFHKIVDVLQPIADRVINQASVDRSRSTADMSELAFYLKLLGMEKTGTPWDRAPSIFFEGSC